jgi:hypothetical protein
VAEADAEGRNSWGQPPDDLDAGARGGRPSRAGGENEVRRPKPLRIVRVDRMLRWTTTSAPSLPKRCARL